MLFEIIKDFTIDDILKIEAKDSQFLAYKNLYENKNFTDENYLFLLIQNALISYQLSGKGEEYHNEFSQWVLENYNKNLEKGDFLSLFSNFLHNCKNNKRFILNKLKRIEKSMKFYNLFIKNTKKYYENMEELAENLADIMKQKKDAKTIVFSVKLFSYGARNVFSYTKIFPENLMIPIDSRLENLYKLDSGKENFSKKEIKDYYINLSKKLNIPLLHLDSLLWVNYEKILKKLKNSN